METELKDFVEFLNSGYGKNACQYLKNGASFKVLLDGQPWRLQKRERQMTAETGAPDEYDITLETTAAAIDYVCQATNQDEALNRLREAILEPSAEKFMRMTPELEASEHGRVQFYWMGYYFWAKRLGFIH